MDNISIQIYSYDGENWNKSSRFSCRTGAKTNNGFTNAIKKVLVGKGVEILDKYSIAVASGYVQDIRWKGIFYFAFGDEFKSVAFKHQKLDMNYMSQIYLDLIAAEDREAQEYMRAAKAVVEQKCQ